MHARAGFTLLEILVVVLIITVLAAIVGVNVANAPGKARHAAATAQIQSFETALKLYRMEQGQYPSQRQGLAVLVAPPDDLPNPAAYPESGYLDSPGVPLDPWGQEYVYLTPGPGSQAYEILTYGADHEPGGTGEAADISSAGQ